MISLWRLSWLFTRRDARAGELNLLAAALVLAVAAIASVGFFVDRMRGALADQAGDLLGADLVIASDAPLPNHLIDAPQARGLVVARAVSFPSMVQAMAPASGGEGATTLASVKAVSRGYPLRGALRVARTAGGADEPATQGPAPGTVWIDPALQGSLSIAPGDRLQVGELTLQVDRLLVLEPDRGAGFVNLAPRVMIAMDDLEATQLISPQSRVTWRWMARGEPGPLKVFQAWVEPQLPRGARLETLESGRPELRSALDRARQFLALVALLSALIAAVAIALAARRFAARHLDACAIVRAIGVEQRRLSAALLLELFWVGVVAGAVGAALGWLGHFILVALAGTALPLKLPAASPWPLLQSMVAGLLLLLGFAAVPLARLAGVSPLRVLRRDLGAPPVSAWLAALLALAVFSVLLIWFAGDLRLALWALLGFVGGSVLFVLVAWTVVSLVEPARRLVGHRSVAVRLGLASWSRRRAASVTQIAAVSVGLMALLLLTITRGDLLQSWQRASPPDAPNRFVVNIQPDQIDAVSGWLRDNGLAGASVYPMVRGRVIARNGQDLTPNQLEDDRARRLVDRELNLSYMSAPQPHSQIVAGRWLDPAQPEVSVEVGIARSLGLGLGDRITFEVAGETFEATVTSLRRVAWDSMQVNFFMILSPAVLASRPQTWITAFHLPDRQATALNALVAQLPNLTVFDTRALVQQIQGILEQVVGAVQFLFVFTVAAGLMVLYAALASSRDERIREAGLMRALGASRRHLQRAQWIELAVCGGLAGLLAALGATAVGIVLAEKVFQFEFSARWSAVPMAVAVGAVLSMFAGWIGLRRVIDSPPAATLRETS